MQKNVPKYTPDFVRTVKFWAEASKRDVSYALCNDRRTLLWFANQRAVEYHPTLVLRRRAGARHAPRARPRPARVGDGFADGRAGGAAGAAGARRRRAGRAWSRRAAPRACTSSCPSSAAPMEDAAGATRAIAERAAALDPGIATTAFMKEDRGGKVFVDAHARRRCHRRRRLQPAGAAGRAGVVPRGVGRPRRRRARRLHGPHRARAARRRPDRGRQMPDRQALPPELVEEGKAIPPGRVQAMHEGKRRKRARGDAG